jgi:hypothetical protein
MNVEKDRIAFLLAIKRAHGDLRRRLVQIYEARYSMPVELYLVKGK